MFRIVFLSRLALVAWLAGGMAGCAQHRIPAIDPTGQRIFSGSTTLASHDLLGGGHFHKHQQPAAVAPAAAIAAPPVQPPCTPPVQVVPVMPVPIVAAPQNPLPVAIAAPPVACEPVAYRGPELKLTPGRIVAPVNTEVVIAAGICSPDGYFVTRQPLEWMLAQDGVGQIVAVGHESRHNNSLLTRGSPHKIATNYARAHTSTISQTLDRGTPTPADDVYLQKGQSWISVTSPTEGTSHVVVWTPQEQNWDRRKATATIHWVDAAWRFPPSTTARAGQGQPLTTVVTRANGDPIAGWIVKYEVIDGPPANFGRIGTMIEVPTDATGRATATLGPASPEQGITTVNVQIIRPGRAPGDAPHMIVGQGMIGVPWTSPGLAVRAIGTSAVTADGAIGYRVEVTNTGDQVTHNAALSYTPPAGVTVLNSTPAAQVFGQRLEWRLGDLPPGTTSVVEINCRAAAAGSVRSAFIATSAEVAKAEGRATTEVRTNALAVKMTGPEAVEVGREARFLVDVTNNGPTALANVTATDTFDPGLAHAAGERSPLVRPIAILQPGQTERIAISFIVSQPGRQCHRLDVTAEGGHAAGARGCVTGIAAVVSPPQLSVRVTGPATRRQGETGQYAVEVRNNGSAPATNVVLQVTWGLNLELLEASPGREDNIARLTTTWRIPQLSGGESQTRQLNCACLNADAQGALVRATVSSQQTAAVTNQTATVITPAPSGAPRTAPAPQSATPIQPEASAPLAGVGIKLSASALADPIGLGTTTTVLISVTNERSGPDRDVTLSVQAIGDGLTIRAAGTPAPAVASSATAIDFGPVREIRAGEQLPSPYRIEVRGVRPGRHKLRISATSALSPSGAATEVELGVNP